MPRSIAIIGAGFTGLAAGCYARMNGYEVDIFEQHWAPGGLCTAWERQGYTFDYCVHFLYGSDPSSLFGKIWTELGVLEGQRFIDPEIHAVTEDADGRRLTFYTDPERLREEMKRVSPGDARIIDHFVSGIQGLRHLDFPDAPAPEILTWRDKLGMVRHLPLLLRMTRWARLTVQNYAARFKDPFLGWALRALNGLPDFPLLSTLFVHAWLADRNAGYPVGGSLALTRALAKRAEELGCRLHYRSRVDKILVEEDRAAGERAAGVRASSGRARRDRASGSRAVGVRVAGREHRADWVIAAGDLHATVFDLLGGRYLAEEHLRRFRERKIFDPMAMVSFGVKRTFPGEPEAISGTLVRLPQARLLGGLERDCVHYRLHHFDPTLAPPGKTAVTCGQTVDYDHWKELAADRGRYERAKEELAEAYLTILDQRFPGFRADVEVVDVATPVTLERFTSNWRGSIEGWLINRTNMLTQLRRTLPGLDGLYLAGQWLQPGGGLPTGAMQGKSVVQVICHRDRRPFVTA